MSLEDACIIHDIIVLEERTTSSGSMAPHKEWVVSTTVLGRAVQVHVGGTIAMDMFQKGFKKPWIIMFLPENNPQLSPLLNRLRYTDPDGIVHDIEVRAYRSTIDADGVIRYYVAEGEELTQRPKSPTP